MNYTVTLSVDFDNDLSLVKTFELIAPNDFVALQLALDKAEELVEKPILNYEIIELDSTIESREVH